VSPVQPKQLITFRGPSTVSKKLRVLIHFEKLVKGFTHARCLDVVNLVGSPYNATYRKVGFLDTQVYHIKKYYYDVVKQNYKKWLGRENLSEYNSGRKHSGPVGTNHTLPQPAETDFFLGFFGLCFVFPCVVLSDSEVTIQCVVEYRT